ncbi:hypothetical protein ZIOFF_041583 [Zingiber officinale]|uniref:Exonuclease domain-containing protein n=1 Tax=Zingiber officinale TaxID=94328 RepID=A0A8J5L607_ZINOF|nr:hypothetical protein ZIOFF_041583 [Zingiber officinale]
MICTRDVGNLCVIFFAGKILDAGSTLLRMSLSVFFGNLHQLLNNLGSNSTIKFLKLQYCTCKQFHVWRYNRQNSAPVNEARFGLQSSIATCNNPLSNLQNELVSVRAWSSKTTRLKSRKLSTNRATPRKIEKLIVRASTKNSKNQTELLQPKTVNCNGFQQSTAVRKAIDWPATILVFDIETTGFSRQYERIIEIAIRDLIGGKDSTFETLINPKKPVSNTYVHGIQYDMVNRPDVPTSLLSSITVLCIALAVNISCAEIMDIFLFDLFQFPVLFRELVPILLQYVRSRQMPGKPVILVAHNARQFDVPFITNEFQRCSMDIPEDWGFLDTLPLARQLVMPDGRIMSRRKPHAHKEEFCIGVVFVSWSERGTVNLSCVRGTRHDTTLILASDRQVDMLNLSNQGSKLPSVKLQSLGEHYGIPLVGPAHRAMPDVTLLCNVLQRITFDLKLTVSQLLDLALRPKRHSDVPP